MNLVYLNGSYLTLEEARLPITDRGFTYGDGVFTTLKVSEGQAALSGEASHAPRPRRGGCKAYGAHQRDRGCVYRARLAARHAERGTKGCIDPRCWRTRTLNEERLGIYRPRGRLGASSTAPMPARGYRTRRARDARGP